MAFAYFYTAAQAVKMLLRLLRVGVLILPKNVIYT